MNHSQYQTIDTVSINHLLGKKILIFDTETTGLPKKWQTYDGYHDYHENEAYNSSRILSIGWGYSPCFDLTSKPRIVSYLRKPDDFDGSVFEPDAVKVNGITYDHAMKEGIEFNQIYDLFLQDLKDCDYVIGYNVLFDAHILFNELYRHGKQIPTINFLNIQPPHGKLDEWYLKLCGKSPNTIHTADNDVEKLFSCMVQVDYTEQCWKVLSITSKITVF